MTDVTEILSQIKDGDPVAAERLLPLVYAELRRLAAAKLAHERAGHTLQATSLVHDAYIRLVDVRDAQHWNSKGHFFAAAAEAMRRILVESARRKQRLKHGGSRRRINLEAAMSLVDEGPTDDLLALDAALDSLAATEPEKAAIVKLRYFGGLTWEEIAACRGISLATAKRHWLVARAWLYNAMTDKDNESRSREIS